MAERRQPFRFRLPWLAPQPRPSPTGTAVPIRRPPFRPAGIAPTQPPPPQPQPPPSPPPPKTEQPPTSSPSPSPSPKATESQKPTSPPSPSKTTESTKPTSPPSPSKATESTKPTSPPSPPKAIESTKPTSPPSPPKATESPKPTSQTPSPSRTPASVPPSPSRGDAESKPSSVPPSPSRAASQAQQQSQKPSQSPSTSPSKPDPKTASEVSSPSPKATKPEPTAEVVSQTRSPSSSEKSQSANQDSSKSSSVSTQQEQEEAASQPPSQEPKPKEEITSTAIPTSLKDTSTQATSQADGAPREGKQVLGSIATAASREAAEAPVPTQKLDSEAAGKDQKPPSEAKKRESKETEERKKTVEESPKEEKINGVAIEEPEQKTIIEIVTPVPGAEKDTEDVRNVAFGAPKRHQKQDTQNRKETVATTNYIGRQIETVSSSPPKERGSSMLLRDPILSPEEEASKQKEIKENVSKLVNKLTSGHQSYEKPISVITLSGENRGATMHLRSEDAKKEGSIHIHRGYKLNQDDAAENTTDDEASAKGRSSKDHEEREAPPSKAYVNSNVQGVNNSLVFNASVSERDPGVHLTLSKDSAESTTSNGKPEPLHMRKAEFTMTPSERLTHEPTVRRRCLRGLLLEPSDSEPDNPNKPRRHGCRYTCGEKGKDNDMEAL